MTKGVGITSKMVPGIVLAIDKETLPPGTGIINRVTPVHMAPVARVTTKGLNPPLAMITPFIKPKERPSNGGIRTHIITFNGVSTKGRLTAMALLNPIIAPIERSIPPLSKTKL